MRGYVPHRQRLASSPVRYSLTVGFGLRLNSATVAIIIPGGQYPHWKAEHSRNDCCTRLNSALTARPSMVCIFLEPTSLTSVMHERTAIPSTSTVHAPHCPSPHPGLVPVRCRSSRSTDGRDAARSPATSQSLPFTFILTALIERRRPLR